MTSFPTRFELGWYMTDGVQDVSDEPCCVAATTASVRIFIGSPEDQEVMSRDTWQLFSIQYIITPCITTGQQPLAVNIVLCKRLAVGVYKRNLQFLERLIMK
jgi:hypothetical protein